MTDKISDKPAFDATVAEEAAEWWVRVTQGGMSRAERRAYLEWLSESRVHIAEILRVSKMARWTGIKLGVQSVTPQVERDELKIVWSVVDVANDRDLVLWAEDAEPVAPRIKQASGIGTTLPETTLKLMAGHERQRRSKRSERVWWAVGVAFSGIVASVGTWLIGC